MRFRGERPAASGEYMAVLGGSVSAGLGVKRAAVDLVAELTGVPFLNLGIANAGPEIYVRNPALLAPAQDATAVLVEICGVQNTSNRFYDVHPLRNDRVIRPKALLRALFPEVDFTAIHFTRHLMAELSHVSPDRFQTVVEEVQASWLDQMTEVLNLLSAPVCLFWLGDGPVDGRRRLTGRDPLFVQRWMVERLAQSTEAFVEARAPKSMLRNTLTPTPDVFGEGGHHALARALVPVLDGMRTRIPTASASKPNDSSDAA